jgi:hypothetical protein
LLLKLGENLALAATLGIALLLCGLPFLIEGCKLRGTVVELPLKPGLALA